MKTEFSYIRNRIGEYKKDDIIRYCLLILDNNKKTIYPIWLVLTLVKWTILFGEKKYPPKQFSIEIFKKLIRYIGEFGNEHILSFLTAEGINKGFQIIYSQQFYLQKSVYKEIFARHLKLFSTIKTKYNIEKSFEDKTGLNIKEFVYIQQLFYLVINIDTLENTKFKFNGYFDSDFINIANQLTSPEKIQFFINLLTLDLNDAIDNIEKFKYKVRNYNLQSLEISFFTMYPLIYFDDKLKLVHSKVFSYNLNYYIYDFLRSNDENFTTDFGIRLERYVEDGLKEINYSYLNEKELKNLLPENSTLTDFYIDDQNIFIECKAAEIQVLPSINPTDELIFNSLKTSLFKAYFDQIVPVANTINPNGESWGIILTYKEFYWSHYTKLFEIGKDKYPITLNYTLIPPENVFIIDLNTWDKIIQIVKDKKASLIDILVKARENNKHPVTTKQLFDMHLDEYNLEYFTLSYLENEFKHLEIRPQ